MLLTLCGSAGVAQARTTAKLGFTPLTLKNGWTGGPFSAGTPAVVIVSGIVHFKGAMTTGGTSPYPFTLPVGFRPAKNVYIPVDMANATNGRLIIQANGTVGVQAENSFANAKTFTSLDGASFAAGAQLVFTPLTLTNGWTGGPNGTALPAVPNASGIVHFKGGMKTPGTSANPFSLPTAFRPAKTVYVPVDLCTGQNGRLRIDPDGTVAVDSELGYPKPQCFTSLDGASFAIGAQPVFTPLTLKNGWTGGPFSTALPSVASASGIVYFKGAMSTAGTNPAAFTLPAGFRPAKTVYIKVDMCNTTNGRLIIRADGTVSVEPESSFSDSRCFASLDGASFAR